MYSSVTFKGKPKLRVIIPMKSILSILVEIKFVTAFFEFSVSSSGNYTISLKVVLLFNPSPSLRSKRTSHSPMCLSKNGRMSKNVSNFFLSKVKSMNFSLFTGINISTETVSLLKSS